VVDLSVPKFVVLIKLTCLGALALLGYLSMAKVYVVENISKIQRKVW
jgi:hypothetical protein